MSLVSLVIVNYRTPKQTTLCLRSIRRYTRIPYEAIVIDNRSGDASLDYLRQLSWIRLVESNCEQPNHVNGLDLGVAHSMSSLHVDHSQRQ